MSPNINYQLNQISYDENTFNFIIAILHFPFEFGWPRNSKI